MLLALIAKPAYPVFGAGTVLQWGSGALSSMVSRVQEHPWLAGATVGAVALGAAWLYVQRSEKLAAMRYEESKAKYDEELAKQEEERLEKATNEFNQAMKEFEDARKCVEELKDKIPAEFSEEKSEIDKLFDKAVSQVNPSLVNKHNYKKATESLKILQKKIETLPEYSALRNAREEIKKLHELGLNCFKQNEVLPDAVKELFEQADITKFADIAYDSEGTSLAGVAASLYKKNELTKMIEGRIECYELSSSAAERITQSLNEIKDKIEQIFAEELGNMKDEFSLDGFQL